MCTSAAPASNASWVDSICSSGVIGTAGFCAWVGSEPVMATLMTQGCRVSPDSATGLPAAAAHHAERSGFGFLAILVALGGHEPRRRRGARLGAKIISHAGAFGGGAAE